MTSNAMTFYISLPKTSVSNFHGNSYSMKLIVIEWNNFFRKFLKHPLNNTCNYDEKSYNLLGKPFFNKHFPFFRLHFLHTITKANSIEKGIGMFIILYCRASLLRNCQSVFKWVFPVANLFFRLWPR